MFDHKAKTIAPIVLDLWVKNKIVWKFWLFEKSVFWTALVYTHTAIHLVYTHFTFQALKSATVKNYKYQVCYGLARCLNDIFSNSQKQNRNSLKESSIKKCLKITTEFLRLRAHSVLCTWLRPCWADFCVYPTPIRLQSELKIPFLICSARLVQRIVV